MMVLSSPADIGKQFKDKSQYVEQMEFDLEEQKVLKKF